MFAATEEDVQKLDIVTYVPPFHLRSGSPNARHIEKHDRQLERLQLYITPSDSRKVVRAAKSRARREVPGLTPEFPELLANSIAVAGATASSATHAASPRGGKGSDRLKQEVRQMQTDLEKLRQQNARLVSHVSILEKCRETLVFEEVALVSLSGIDSIASQFETQKKQARQKFESSVAKLSSTAIVAPA
jgi:hypothetical protein